MSCLNVALVVLSTALAGLSETDFPSRPFYVPENPKYTIVDSTLDSIRFTLEKTLRRDQRGHLASISTFVNPQAEVMAWHDFGNLEGPGWVANTVGGAYEIYLLGEFLHKPEWQDKGIAILDHVPGRRVHRREVRLYPRLSGDHHRQTLLELQAQVRLVLPRFDGQNGLSTADLCRPTWGRPAGEAHAGGGCRLCGVDPRPRSNRRRTVGSPAAPPRRAKCTDDRPTATKTAVGRLRPTGCSSCSCRRRLPERGLADYRGPLREKTAVFIRLGGIFGSINHDTYDPQENVAYAVAFRTLRDVSRLLKDDAVRAFAYEKCLAGLDQFKMTEDRNGVATKGLLYMEKLWDTAYLWENAEAALAYFEAAAGTRQRDLTRSRQYEMDGLVILRAIAKHHYGPHGFLTEGVDWNNHVGQGNHIGKKKFAAICYTEPFLNGQHIAEPTLYYLKNLARTTAARNAAEWRDIEGNVILR